MLSHLQILDCFLQEPNVQSQYFFDTTVFTSQLNTTMREGDSQQTDLCARNNTQYLVNLLVLRNGDFNDHIDMIMSHLQIVDCFL